MVDVLSSRSFILSILTAIAGALYYSYALSLNTTYSDSRTFAAPHYPSWKTWFHPSRWNTSHIPLVPADDGWNIHHHLGGYGPWVEKLDGEDELQGIDPPDRCTIDQVHMMSRHAERYPTKSAGKRHIALLNRINEAGVPLNDSLSFINNWTYFTSDPQRDFEQLTATGPYAGTLEAFTTGVRFLTRYEHLVPHDSKTKLWASDSARVISTARYFTSGLFGLGWETNGKAELEVIPETFERRADTLTPGDTCLRYIEDKDHGHDYGMNMLALFQQTYIPAIAERLITAQGNQALGTLTNWEVFSMQEMCGFETTSRGSSPWCDVFTHEDWENFEYARDLVHYYRGGPGNPYAGAMGWLWLNATTDLLRAGSGAGTMFFSFVHDGDIAPFLAALDIMRDSKYDPSLPVTHVAQDRVWRTSAVLPMGGRVTLERMTCSSTGGRDEAFLRVNINDKIVPLPYCRSGPGMSCSLAEFFGHVDRRRVDFGDFKAVCGLEGDVGRITFLRQE